MMETRRRAVLDLSVYNAVSLARRDLTIRETVNRLQAGWSPAWAPVREVVTVDTVQESAERLGRLGFTKCEQDTITIPVRDPRTGQGRYVQLDKTRTQLQTRGTA